MMPPEIYHSCGQGATKNVGVAYQNQTPTTKIQEFCYTVVLYMDDMLIHYPIV